MGHVHTDVLNFSVLKLYSMMFSLPMVAIYHLCMHFIFSSSCIFFSFSFFLTKFVVVFGYVRLNLMNHFVGFIPCQICL